MKNKTANQLFAGILAVTLVVAGPMAPMTSAQAAQTKTVTVTNAKQLRAALKNNKVTKITIKTAKDIAITIPVGTYGKKQLVINAPKATIRNQGNFKAISIADAKKYTEKGSANKITIKDKNSLSFVASVVSSATKVTVASDGKKLVVTDNGDIRSLNVKAKTALTVKGKSESTPVVVSADGSSLTIQKKADVNLKADVKAVHVTADAKIEISKNAKVEAVYVDQAVQVELSGETKDSVPVIVNAEGAKVTTAIDVEVTANAKTEITGPDGKTQTVAAGETVKSQDDTKTDDKVDDKADDKKENTSTGGSNGSVSADNSGSSPSTSVKSDFVVTSATFNGEGTQLDVAMAETAGAQFKLDGQSLTGVYSDTKYVFTFEEIKGGAHTLTIAKDGYNTKTMTIKFAPKPVVNFIPSGDAETVFKSDVASLQERGYEVSNYLAGTAFSIEKTYCKETAGGEALSSWEAVKTYLSETENAKVVATYIVSYEGVSSEPKAVTYTVKADRIATKVEITGNGKVGECLTATAKNDEGEAGGGITYQWVSCDTEEGTYANITGETGQNLVISADQYNRYVKCTIKNKDSDDVISSDAIKIIGQAQITVSDITYTGNTKETAMENGATLEAGKLNGTAKYGETEVSGTWSFTSDTTLAASKTVTVKFTPANAAYAEQTGNVYIYVKAATPEKLALSTDTSELANGKTKFTTAPEGVQYKIGTNGTWADVSTAEFDAKVGDEIYFRTAEKGNAGTDGYLAASDATAEALRVTEDNIGVTATVIYETLLADNVNDWVTYDTNTGTATIKASKKDGNTIYKLEAISYDVFVNNGEDTFDGNLKKVVFEEESCVKTIAGAAFEGCDKLTSINLPDTVTAINSGTFYGCSSLTSVNIPDGVTAIGSDAFFRCDSLSSLTIPDSVKSIGEHAFNNCPFTSITIPDSVTQIGANAFFNCRSLQSVVLPNALQEIADELFTGCEALTTVNIPDSVTSIGWGAFADCVSLTNITIPDTVTAVHGTAFHNTGLTSLSLPNSIKNYCVYGKYDEVTSVEIPDGITSIGDKTFEGYTKLSSVTIPTSVTSIGIRAFYGCEKLTSLQIPGTVTTIESGALGAIVFTDLQYGGMVSQVEELFADAFSLSFKDEEAMSGVEISITCTDGTLKYSYAKDTFSKVSGD